MSLNYLNQIPIENVSPNTIPLFCVLLCIAEIFLHVLLKRKFGRNCEFSESFVESELESKAQGQYFDPSCSSGKMEDPHLRREDVETVMERLGILCRPEANDEKLGERLGSDEISNLFGEKEPSLEEVKEAFDVFDENKDGFIDAQELQRILCGLGFKDELEMKNCKRMINAFDDNGDGRIDFGEFVKLMESTFC
ncbi:hypothetical protein U1Q18_038543 [Sarracenia purpurea var. burkii]